MEQCEFYIQESGGLVRCDQPVSQSYKFEDFSEINLFYQHLMKFCEALCPDYFV
jgi:hypothetical protein